MVLRFPVTLIPLALQFVEPGAQQRPAPTLPLFDRFDGKDRLGAGVVTFFADAVFGPPIFHLRGVTLREPLARHAQAFEWCALSCFPRPLNRHGG